MYLGKFYLVPQASITSAAPSVNMREAQLMSERPFPYGALMAEGHLRQWLAPFITVI
jgi:hypothetical protein